jgi:hypothetical protein
MTTLNYFVLLKYAGSLRGLSRSRLMLHKICNWGYSVTSSIKFHLTSRWLVATVFYPISNRVA